MAPLFHVEALLPSSISPKIDSILHSHIYPQVGHVFRAVARSSGGTPAGEDDAEASPAVNEIDKLAEKFIARFHAKFLLEKQESYRRYQEMIARSI
uniref:Uncharacterized protein n=1 Tax=Aegilops tauschii subsp. strangulata TaxID=200361 RepID=A0A453D3V6_AEGTS